MAKKRFPFKDLVIRRQNHRPLKPRERTPIHGLDSESCQGYAFLICDDKGNYLDLRGLKGRKRLQSILGFLTRYSLQYSFNFFYNLDADVTFILKHFGEKYVREIYEKGYFKWGKYRIKYLKDKVLTIRWKNHCVHFYDLLQYYQSSLKMASKQYLNEDKIEYDVSNLTLEKINKDFERIKQYCLKDALLCQKLGFYFYKTLKEDLNFHPQNFISTGNLAMQYFRQKVNKFPNPTHDIPKEVLEYAYNSYRGGWFEAYQIGFFPKVWQYDINSAYPSIIANLPNTSGKIGTWIKSRKYLKESLIGFIKCKIILKEGCLFPMAIKHNETNIYPIGKFPDPVYLTKDEVEYLLNDPLAKVKIVNGWYFFPSKTVGVITPFKEEIEKLYEIKNNSQGMLKLNTKLILNSLYGKFWETQPYKKDSHKGYTGKIWNPIYASLITAGTRLTILNLINHYHLQNNIIDISTDSVTLTKPISLNSNQLGNWKLSVNGKSFLNLMSGMNEVIGENKIKFRGFHPDKGFSYYKTLKEHPDWDYYEVPNNRMITIGDVFHKDKLFSFKDLGCFIKEIKKFDLNSNIKRFFLISKSLKAKDLLSKKFKSEPHFIEDLVLK